MILYQRKNQLDSNEFDCIRKLNKINGLREIEVSHLPQIEENQVKVSNTNFFPHSHSPLSLCKKKSQSE